MSQVKVEEAVESGEIMSVKLLDFLLPRTTALFLDSTLLQERNKSGGLN